MGPFVVGLTFSAFLLVYIFLNINPAMKTIQFLQYFWRLHYRFSTSQQMRRRRGRGGGQLEVLQFNGKQLLSTVVEV